MASVSPAARKAAQLARKLLDPPFSREQRTDRDERIDRLTALAARNGVYMIEAGREAGIPFQTRGGAYDWPAGYVETFEDREYLGRMHGLADAVPAVEDEPEADDFDPADPADLDEELQTV